MILSRCWRCGGEPFELDTLGTKYVCAECGHELASFLVEQFEATGLSWSPLDGGLVLTRFECDSSPGGEHWQMLLDNKVRRRELRAALN